MRSNMDYWSCAVGQLQPSRSGRQRRNRGLWRNRPSSMFPPATSQTTSGGTDSQIRSRCPGHLPYPGMRPSPKLGSPRWLLGMFDSRTIAPAVIANGVQPGVSSHLPPRQASGIESRFSPISATNFGLVKKALPIASHIAPLRLRQLAVTRELEFPLGACRVEVRRGIKGLDRSDVRRIQLEVASAVNNVALVPAEGQPLGVDVIGLGEVCSGDKPSACANLRKAAGARRCSRR